MQIHFKDALDWKEYRPIGFIFQSLGYLTKTATRKWLFSLTFLAEWTGLEPATPGVTGRYSNQLNYHSKQRPRTEERHDSFSYGITRYAH